MLGPKWPKDENDFGVDQDSQLVQNGILKDGFIPEKGSQFEIANFLELAPHLSLNIDKSHKWSCACCP